MEGSSRSRKDRLPVQRSFDISRLEKQLLAQAYELAVPVITRCLSESKRKAEERHATDSGGDSPLIKGA